MAYYHVSDSDIVSLMRKAGKKYYQHKMNCCCDLDLINKILEPLEIATKEYAGILCIKDQKISSMHIVSIGILNRTVVHPREVFFHAIKEKADGIVFFHNHPSGQAEASEEDKHLTRRLRDAGNILGIYLYGSVVKTVHTTVIVAEN